VPGGEIFTGSTTTRVTFRILDEALAREYVATGEPMDKAGAYGIQGLGSALVREVQGDYTAVVGFPLPLFLNLLERGGRHYDFTGLVPVPPPEAP
jgi:septum formation protein